MCKKLFLTVIALAVFTLNTTADVLLNVNLSIGSTVVIPFAQEPEITFSGTTMTVSSLTSSTTYKFSKVKNITYSTGEAPAGINDIIAKAGMQLSNGIAVINGLNAKDAVNIYNAGGQLLKTLNAETSGVVVIDASQFPEGILIIKTPGASFKINK